MGTAGIYIDLSVCVSVVLSAGDRRTGWMSVCLGMTASAHVPQVSLGAGSLPLSCAPLPTCVNGYIRVHAHPTPCAHVFVLSP